MSAPELQPSNGECGQQPEPSRWTATFVVHSSNRLIHAVRFGVYQRAFFRHITDKNARILDVGCGSGEFAGLLAQHGYRNLHGVEIDVALADLAAGVIPDVRKASATALPFADNSFDCIYLFNVMHHLSGMEEYELALTEMQRCLRDGGRIILVEPCRLILYRLLRAVCRVGSPFSRFCRNFAIILNEEWPQLTVFLRSLAALRRKIATAAGVTVVEERMLLHQWLCVFAVAKRDAGGTVGES